MNKFHMMLAAVGLLCLVVSVPYVQGQRTPSVSPKQTWEYRVDVVPGTGFCDRQTYTAEVCDQIFSRNAALDSRLINQRAAEGWELAAVGGNNYYFKRAK
jgi:hypothetical protein